MSSAIFPGSFDPPTFGHLNLIQRASTLFDELHVLIATNSGKSYWFSQDERFVMLTALCVDFPNVKVVCWPHFVVDYARQNAIGIIVRGVRPLTDFAMEFEQALYNKELNHEVETLFIPSAGKYAIIRSSAIKDIACFGGNVSRMVPPIVATTIHKKLATCKQQGIHPLTTS